MTIITRFAPSPTGFLHIGSARTALFNYLFTKKNNGKFLLRIEDTDFKRSSKEAIDAIINGLKWLQIEWDQEEIFQSKRVQRHVEIANILLQNKKAYKCYLSKEELETLREESRITGKPIISKWRDKSDDDAPYGIKPVIRIKSDLDGEIIVNDLVQGKVVFKNNIMDDFVLLREDMTPTYMLAVVVDDFDMNITHVIRGDDHMSNTPKQILLYNSMDWQIPAFAHIPLIHGADGAKLSKRHGALGVEAYRELGYLPEAINNYLLRLGWSHGNDEIISMTDACKWFDIKDVGKSPSRMDFNKLDHINSYYLKKHDNQTLVNLIENYDVILSDDSKESVLKAMDLIKERSKTMLELIKNAKIFFINEKIEIEENAKLIFDPSSDIYKEFRLKLEKNIIWEKEKLMAVAKEFAEEKNIKLGDLVVNFRIALTGSNASPSIFDIMAIIGKKETLRRIKHE